MARVIVLSGLVVHVIRNTKTGEYFDKGKWTQGLDLAQHFKGPSEVMKVCAAFELKDVEMLVRIDPEEPCLRVPIPNQ